MDAAGSAARLVQLLTLVQARPRWDAAELAARLGVSPRTLRRDLSRLARLGYQVEGRPGPGGHYRLVAGSRLPPMVFEDDEVVALVAALRTVEDGPVGEAATRALVKLRQVLPRRLAHLAAQVADHTEAVAVEGPPAAGTAAAAALLGALTAAAAADLGVRFTYTDRHGRTSRRSVDSVRCLLVRGRWVVLAFDTGRDGWRVFRLDRVHDLVEGRATVRRALPAEDLAAWLRSDFGRA